ncbi:MAG: class I SAM-dependent methyltransferase [Rubrivivax sp.]
MSEAAMTQDLKGRMRPLYTSVFERSPTARMLYLLAAPRMRRDTEFVRDGYMGSWSAYEERLDRAATVDDWICIRGFDDAPTTHVFEGKIRHSGFDTNRVWIDEIVKTIAEHFPGARSITEYGCGVGRNLLAIKQRFPEMACYGYELADAGVHVARSAAKKFKLDVKYAQLDYIKDGRDKYVHPKTDLAITVFSLERNPARERRRGEEHARSRRARHDPRRAGRRELSEELPRNARAPLFEARRLPPELRRWRARAPAPRRPRARAPDEP